MPTFTCDKCNAVFKYRSLFERHRERKTPCAPTSGVAARGPTHRCGHCGTYFTTYSNMRRHVRTTCPKLHRKSEDAKEDARAFVPEASRAYGPNEPERGARRIPGVYSR